MKTKLEKLKDFQNHKHAKILLACLLLLIVFYVIFKPKYEKTDNAYLKADIVVIRPKVSGFIVKTIANDNQFLKQGQLIAKIEDTEYKLKLAQAEEQMKIAQAKFSQAEEQVKIIESEIQSTLHAKESAKINMNNSKNELERAYILLKDKAVSQTNYEQIESTYYNSKSTFVTAESNYKNKLRQYQISILNCNEVRSMLKSAEANFNLAKIDLENTEIKAPTSGTVTKKNLQLGQLVSPNQALGYFVQNKVWVVANFKESQIGRMKPLQKVLIEIDSFPEKNFIGIVDSISPATGAEFSILPPENGTGNFTKIVQRVPVKIIFEQGQDLSLLKSGLSCEVKVKL